MIKVSRFIKQAMFFAAVLAANFFNNSIVAGQVASLKSSLSDSVVVSNNSSFPVEPIGAATVIGSEKFNGGLIISPEELILGKVPGVRITSNSGKPGTKFTIQIRGNSTILSDNAPLLVVDNVPFYDTEIAVNPNDIEAITVYKGGWAVALFGERASAGAIVITTKKGGKAFKVTYSGKFGVSSLPKQIDVFSGDEFRKLNYDLSNGNIAILSLLGNQNTNWQNEIYHTAIGQDHHIGISGSVKMIPFRLSVGRTNQDGILKTSEYRRTSAGISIDPSFFGDHLKVSINLQGIFNRNRLANERAISGAVRFDPTQPIFSSNGDYFKYPGSTFLLYQNPVAELNYSNNDEVVDNYWGHVKVDYKLHFFPELKFSFLYGEKRVESSLKSVTSTAATWVNNGQGEIISQEYKPKNKIKDLSVNYSKQFNYLNCSLDITLGAMDQNLELDRNSVQTDIITNQINSSSTYWEKTKSESVYSRIGLGINNKYTINFSARRDSDSRYADDSKHNISYVSSLMWNIKNELFLKEVKPLSALNLDLEYSITGLYTQFSQLNYSVIDPNLKREHQRTFSIGLNYGLFQNRIIGNLSYYSRYGENLYVTAPIGFSTALLMNGGDMRNKGLEADLNVKVISTKVLQWDISFNAAYNKNEIVSQLYSDNPNFLGFYSGAIAGPGSFIFLQREGNPVNSFFVLKQVYDHLGNPIEGVYVDRLGAGGNIAGNPWNRYLFKKPTPDWIMGVSSSLNYRSWDFAFSGRLSLGNYVYNSVSATSYYDNLSFNGHLWNIPKLVNDTKFNSRQPYSDYYVENASFFRMDYISLGYSFKNLWKEKLGIRVSATVQNAFVVTKYKGLDPEVATGIDTYSYPRARTFSFGVNMEF